MKVRQAVFVILTVFMLSVQVPAQKSEPKIARPSTDKVTEKKISVPKVFTWRDFCDSTIPYHRRTMIEAYKNHGVKDSKWDDQVLAFMERYIQVSVGAKNAPTIPELAADAQKLTDLGCSDPLARSLCGIAFLCNQENAKALSLLMNSPDELQKSKYCKWRATVALKYLRIAGRGTSITSDEAERRDKLEIDLVVQSVEDDSYLPGDERIMINNLEKTFDIYDRKRIYPELRKSPKLNKYFCNLMDGKDEIKKAWEARGPGYAYQLKPEGVRGMEEHLSAATKLLTEAWKLHPDYPQAPKEMIEVAMANCGEGDSPRVWFDRTIAAQFDYVPAYDQYLKAIAPEWGGSIDQMYVFGVKCLETRCFDTEVPWQFFRTLHAIEDNSLGGKECWLKPETKRHLEDLYDGYAGACPQRSVHYQTLRAITAWHLGDFVTAKRMLDELGNDHSKDAFEANFDTSYDIVRKEVDIRGGEFSGDLKRLDALVDSQKWAEALPLARRVLENAKDDKSVVEYINQALPWMQTVSSFSEGKWTDLMAEDGFAAWRKMGGKWTTEADGTIVGTAVNASMLELRALGDFGKRFELRGEIEFGEKQSESRNGGIFLWHPSQPVLISFNRDSDQLSVKESMFREIGLVEHAGVKDRNSFLVQYWDGELTIFLNEKQLHKRLAADVFADQELRIALGGLIWEGCQPLKYRKLQIHKLTEKP